MSQPDPSAKPSDDDMAPGDLPRQLPDEGSERYRFAAVVGDSPRKVRDQVLDRTASAKTAEGASADDLEREARFLARLDHAGAPFALDFVRTPAGAMLVTRSCDGVSLAEAVRRQRDGTPVPGLATTVAVVLTILKACDTVAAAHDQGVVHHAIAPGSILLGNHGQVVVQSWEAALAAKIRPATMRYVAAADPGKVKADGLHHDIQGLGACLFQCLALRAPQRQGSDALGPINAAERERMPPRLEAIVRLALGSNPVEGYRSVGAFADDLREFLASGQAAAFVPGPITRLADRWNRNRMMLLAVGGTLAVAAVLTALVAGPHLSSLAAWGAPLIVEKFDDDGWRKHWIERSTLKSTFTVRDGRLVSTSERDAMLIYRHRLTTPVVIEYTGRIAKDSKPCDLSVLWSENSGVEANPARFFDTGRNYMIQAGAFGNSFCAMFRNPGRTMMAHHNLQLEAGRDYRFRVELDGSRITMAIDGETVLDAREQIPTRSGFIGLYGFYPGKEFDDVRIWQRTPAVLADALSPGDEALLAKRYDLAAELYNRVSEVSTEGALGQQSLYRQGLAQWYQGRDDLARSAWDQVTDGPLKADIDGLRFERLFNTDRLTPHLSRFEEQYRNAPDLRDSLRRNWRTIIQYQLESPKRDLYVIDYFLKLRNDLFPDDSTCRFVASNALVTLGRYQALLDTLPDQRLAVTQALLGLGRTAEVLATPWTGTDERFAAMMMRGDFTGVAASTGVLPMARARCLAKLGRAEEALDDPAMRPHALLQAGRAADLLATRPLSAKDCNEALICLGRFAEAAGEGLPAIPGSGNDPTALLMLDQLDEAERVAKKSWPAIRLMRAIETGNNAGKAAFAAKVVLPDNLGGIGGGWFGPLVVVPFCEALAGDPAAPERLLRDKLGLLEGIYAGRAWFVVRGVLGDITPEAVTQMTAASEAEAWRLVVTGIRADLAGDAAPGAAGLAASQAYAAFLALPMHRRLLNIGQPDVDVEWFVRWRLRELRKAASR